MNHEAKETQEFLSFLDSKEYDYTIKNGSIFISHDGKVIIDSDIEIPAHTVFINKGSVYANCISSVKEIGFHNTGSVFLAGVTTLNHPAIFDCKGSVYLRNVKSITEQVYFGNSGYVDLNNLEYSQEAEIVFQNLGPVYLNNLSTPKGELKFYNSDSVFLRSLKLFPNNYTFENHGSVYLKSPACEEMNSSLFQELTGANVFIMVV